MTAPPASRQKVAVRRSRCSSGCGFFARADFAIRPGFDARGRNPLRQRASFDKRAEVLAALLERPVLVVGGAGRRQQHDVARLGGGAGGGDGGGEVAAVVQRHAGAGQRGVDLGRGFADQIGAARRSASGATSGA